MDMRYIKEIHASYKAKHASNGEWTLFCSRCDFPVLNLAKIPAYCVNCGARMDGEEKNDD